MFRMDYFRLTSILIFFFKKHTQCRACKYLAIVLGEGEGEASFVVCHFPWYKCSHQGWVQTPSVKPPGLQKS